LPGIGGRVLAAPGFIIFASALFRGEDAKEEAAKADGSVSAQEESEEDVILSDEEPAYGDLATPRDESLDQSLSSLDWMQAISSGCASL